MKKYVIGMDIGGSKTLCGLFDEQMRLVRVIQRPTDAELTAGEMMDALDAYARELTRGAGVHAALDCAAGGSARPGHGLSLACGFRRRRAFGNGGSLPA